MKLLFILFLLLYLPLYSTNYLFGQDKVNLFQMFKLSLKKWNINYSTLEKHKAGAICIPFKNKELKALGFSHQMFDVEYAKRIAMEGCNQMKKKKILSDCICEIIVLDEIQIGDK